MAVFSFRSVPYQLVIYLVRMYPGKKKGKAQKRQMMGNEPETEKDTEQGQSPTTRPESIRIICAEKRRVTSPDRERPSPSRSGSPAHVQVRQSTPSRSVSPVQIQVCRTTPSVSPVLRHDREETPGTSTGRGGLRVYIQATSRSK